jgi:beta-1,2-mannobiose phosphorylase / 1,2-beta-oligomannan phosphorylase
MLRPEDVPPSVHDWEVIGAFNPGAVRGENEIVLLIRVAERPRERRPGFTALPRWSPDTGFTIDWVANDELEPVDPRVVRRRADGLLRLTFVSHLRLAYSSDGKTIDRLGDAALIPASIDEEYGVEDPRITPIEGRYYITYVAVSRYGAATALASTADFKSFERHGIIFCPENKDVVLFPERVSDRYMALHRPVGATAFTRPQMWIASSPDLVHWGQHKYLYGGQHEWESGRIGGGTPPILIRKGWLEIYHGNLRTIVPGQVGAYFGAAMLLDKADPSRVIATGREPLLTPTEEFEREGFVANVVFPTAIVPESDRMLIYYGASDKYTGVVEMSQADISATLE